MYNEAFAFANSRKSQNSNAGATFGGSECNTKSFFNNGGNSL